MADADNFFNKIITVDVTWCFAYNPETKRLSSQWVREISSRPKKLKFQRSHIKTMWMICFDSLGVLHKEFVPEGKTVNTEFYKEKWIASCRAFNEFVQQRSTLEIRSSCTIMDPPTKLQDFPNFWPKKCHNYLLLPYSPDLSPPDQFVFPKLKMKLKWFHFADVAEIQKAVTDKLKKVKKEKF